MNYGLKGTLLTAALIGAATASFAQAKITSVDVNKTETGVEITVVGDGLTMPRELRVSNGTSYIAEFDGSLAIKPMFRKVASAGVQQVDVIWFQSRPPKARVHVKLDKDSIPTVAAIQGGFKISIPVLTLKDAITKSVLPPTTGSEKPTIGPKPEPEFMPTTGKKPEPKQNSKPAGTPETQSGNTGSLNPGELNAKPIKNSEPVRPMLPKANTQTEIPKPKFEAPKTPDLQLNGAGSTGGQKQTSAFKPVNLNFVNTDVVTILNALAIEAGASIVAQPDVSPSDKPVKITVRLMNASLDDALTYVTVMANLRYAKLNNTFFVTRSDNFAQTMRTIFERGAARFETRVVSLVSGEAAQIRRAVFGAKPQDGSGGFYDIQDPYLGMQLQAQAQAQSQPQVDPQAGANGGGQKQGGQAPQGQPNQPTITPGRINYLMVVGEPRRLNEIADYIRALDQEIAGSFSVSRGMDIGSVAVPIQSNQTEKVKAMIEKLLENNPRKSDFSISDTSLKELTQGGDSPTTMLLMIGPKNDLEALKGYAEVMDEQMCKVTGITYSKDGSDLGRNYEVVDLNYLEPTLAAFDLKNRIRGLYVTVLPDPVTPGLTGEDKKEKTDQTSKDDKNGGQGATTEQKDTVTKQVGREPMKLILRGTRQQIEDAKAYLAMVDIEPKQIAVEMRVMELTKEQAETMGFNWDLVTGGRLTKLTLNKGGDTGNVGGDYRFRGADVVKFLANLDKTNEGRNLIARPNTLISDGRTSHLFVGDTVRYVESIQATQNGVTVQTASIDVGVTFDIKARIGNDDNIALDLSQNLTILNGFTAVPGGGNLPQTSERRATNFVNMRAGEIVAFGGLIQEQDRNKVSGIPILMDIPILGQLFRRSEKTKDRKEIVFFLAAVPVDSSNRGNAASPRNSEVKDPLPLDKYKKNGGGN